MAAEQRESGTDQEFLEHLRSLPSQHMRTLLWDQGVLTLWKPSLASPDLLLFLQGSRLKSSSLAMQSLGSGPWLKLSRWRLGLWWQEAQPRKPISSRKSPFFFSSRANLAYLWKWHCTTCLRNGAQNFLQVETGACLGADEEIGSSRGLASCELFCFGLGASKAVCYSG